MANFCVRCGIPLTIGNTSDFCNEHAESNQADIGATIRCPFCSEIILASAKKCKHCGEFIKDRNAVDVGYLPPGIAQKLPSMVRSEVKKLPADKLAQFLEEYERRAKSTGSAYLLWLLLGWHYAYLRKWGIQFLFWLTVGGFLVWWLIDLIRMPSLVADYNKDVAVSVLVNLKAVGD